MILSVRSAMLSKCCIYFSS